MQSCNDYYLCTVCFQVRSMYKDDEGQVLQDAEVFLQSAILHGTINECPAVSEEMRPGITPVLVV